MLLLETFADNASAITAQSNALTTYRHREEINKKNTEMEMYELQRQIVRWCHQERLTSASHVHRIMTSDWSLHSLHQTHCQWYPASITNQI